MVATKPSIGHIATDPLRNFKFRVRINGIDNRFLDMGFMAVSGMNITTEVIPYREGGMNTTTQKMPGQSDFAPLTLSKGLAVGKDAAAMDWMRRMFSVIQGTGTGRAGTEFRGTINILVLDHPVTRGPVPVKAAWTVYNAWPTSIAFSDLDAGANAIIVQQITLAHEGFEMGLAKNIGSESIKAP